mmetsp:Transcript_14457/g.33264  ORF Transcript_14457/g.33264 Transcript_14457/m.33264 type:complete len:416 (-) Transcript_14457:743-1990(-)
MAGTRLLIQSVVLVKMFLLAWLSVHHGFCGSNDDDNKRGNLTKDLPRVPGSAVGVDGGGVFASGVEAQWWEESLCHPVESIAGALLGAMPMDGGGDGGGDDANTDGDGNGACSNPDHEKSNALSLSWKMTLAVENATQLRHWIGLLSEELLPEKEVNGSINSNSSFTEASVFSELLSRHKMGLEIPPVLFSNDPDRVWSHYLDHTTQNSINNNVANAVSEQAQQQQQQQQRLVVYVPASVAPWETSTMGWKAFEGRTTTTQQQQVSFTTLLLPHQAPTTEEDKDDEATATESVAVVSNKLQPLVEDWMARSIQKHQQQHHQQQQRQCTRKTETKPKKTRLTREFPFEHFLAVLMPLLFPLIMPFVVSWIKEYKRYKRLTEKKTKNQTETETTQGSESSATATPLHGGSPGANAEE